MRYLILLVVSIIITSCYTDKKARKSIIKAHAYKPEITSDLCSEFYPVKDSIVIEQKLIKGINDTLYIEISDTIIDTLTDTKTIENKVYKTIYRTDTIYKSVFKTKENTSAISSLNYQLNQCEIEKSVFKSKSKDNAKSKNMWMILFFSLIGLYISKILITKRI